MSIDKIILGTVQFGLQYGINNKSNKPESKEIQKILNFAYEKGIRILDTAESYGTSHLEIGNYHKLSNYKFHLITKYSSKNLGFERKLEQHIIDNLKKLNVENLYAYLFHSFADYESYYLKNIDEIQKCKEKGLVKKIGVSIYTNYEFEYVLKKNNVDLIQLPFNLFDNVNKRIRLIEKAKSQGIEIHSRSSFLQGLFFLDIEKLPQKLSPLKENLKYLNMVSRQFNIDIQTIALNYVLFQKSIDKVLIGIDNLNQLDTNLRYIDNKLSNQLIELINKIDIEDVSLLNPSNW